MEAVEIMKIRALALIVERSRPCAAVLNTYHRLINGRDSASILRQHDQGAQLAVNLKTDCLTQLPASYHRFLQYMH